MADRTRRVRRHVSDDISDSSDASGPDSAELDYDPGRADPIRRPGRDQLVGPQSNAKKPVWTNNPTGGSKSLKLKITPSKLREVVRASEADSLRDTLGGGQVVNGPRKRRSAASQRTSARAAGPRPKYREPVKVTLKPPTKAAKPSKPSRKSTSANVGALNTPMSGAATPDPTKMTKRQRRQETEHLISLDMGPQQRKFFTDAEKAMKKDEHARKRKELTKRKIQEEKAAALNRLLKPQAGKSRGAAPKPETLANLERTHEASMADDDEPMEKPSPLYTRWINNAKGVRLAVPEEWEAKYVGEVLYAPVYQGTTLPPPTRRLVQELD
ncbi:hypothetical protein DV736_g3814, partial [Chaetothyriales sp. CBS 134916]